MPPANQTVTQYPVPPEMAAFMGANGYRLGADISALRRVRDVEAGEAVIFYAGRILEALSAHAVERLEQEASSNCFSNLGVLDDFAMAPRATLDLAHALRRLANQVRHVAREPKPWEWNLAELLCERFLMWFFYGFALGPKLERPEGRFSLDIHAEDPALTEILDMLEREEAGTGGDALLSAYANGREEALVHAPAIAAIVAESLIADGHTKEAEALLTAALAEVPDDLRLRQLMALQFKRRGEIEAAAQILERLERDVPDDDETMGMLAGLSKSIWLKNRTDAKPLERAERLYRNGWKRSKNRNTYLGINAAATALWLGATDKARELARDVLARFTKRSEILKRVGEHEASSRSFFDLVTEAEALLIAGEEVQARSAYAEAFARHAGRHGEIALVRTQAAISLEKLGLAPLGVAKESAV